MAAQSQAESQSNAKHRIGAGSSCKAPLSYEQIDQTGSLPVGQHRYTPANGVVREVNFYSFQFV